MQSGSTLGLAGTRGIIELQSICGRSHISGFFKDLQQNTLHIQVNPNSGNQKLKDLQSQLASLKHGQSFVSAGDSTSTPPLNRINGEEAPTKTNPPQPPPRSEETITNAGPKSSTARHNQELTRNINVVERSRDDTTPMTQSSDSHRTPGGGGVPLWWKGVATACQDSDKDGSNNPIGEGNCQFGVVERRKMKGTTQIISKNTGPWGRHGSVP